VIFVPVVVIIPVQAVVRAAASTAPRGSARPRYGTDPMAYSNLREFIARLEQRGLLKRVTAEVDRDLEIAAIVDRVCKAGGPALLFERVKGSSVPVAINLFGSAERMALALEMDRIEDLPKKVRDVLDLALKPPSGVLDKMRALPKLLEIAGFAPKEVSSGPCQEVVQQSPSLDAFPILRCWPEDGGRFLTFPCVFTHDPETGRRNCGIYRMQVYDARTTGMHMHFQKDAQRHWRKAKAAGRRLETAVAIGPDPAVAFSAACPLPPDADEMFLAGFLRGEGVPMVKGRTVDVRVPADAEIVVEGYIDPVEMRREGPFGDHTGYYSMPMDFPVFHVTAITHRKDPIYHATVVGRPPMEDGWMGLAIERLFLPFLQLALPEVVEYHMPFEGLFHNMLFVSIRKQFPGHARKVMHAFWGLGQAMVEKVIVVVDADVNVHDPSEVAWKALNHIDPERDIEFSLGPIDLLDHASRQVGYGSRMGVDATQKWPEEGFARGWPPEQAMPPAIRALVAKRWKEYGL
jgi:4-hydroxy-3-polyprenylbenzoate decarboxylase